MSTSTPSIECKVCGGSAEYDFTKGCYRCLPCLQARNAAARQQPVAAPQRTPSSPPPEAPPQRPTGPEVPLQELERRFQLEGSSGTEVSLCDCRGCGSQVEIPAGATLAQCPFCDRKVTAQKAHSTTALQEPILVPFGIDKETARRNMEDHLAGLWLRPGTVRRMLSRQGQNPQGLRSFLGLRRPGHHLVERNQHQSAADSGCAISVSGRVKFGEPTGKAVVLPLYVLSLRTGYGSAQIVVNGETGKVASQIPYSWAKLAPVGAAGVAAFALACVVTAGGAAPIVGGVFAWSWWSAKKQRERDEASFLAS